MRKSEIVNSINNVLLIALSIPIVLVGGPTVAGSELILVHLSSIEQVRVEVSGDLRYEPICGMDLAELERQLKEAATRVLADQGISTNPEAGSTLWIRILKKAVSPESNTHYAFAVHLELVEMATLERNAGGEDSPMKVDVTSWSELRLVTSTADEVTENVLSAAEFALKDFAREVAAAR